MENWFRAKVEVVMASTVRPAAVAGRFYPNDPQVLFSDVQSFLSRKKIR